MRDSLESIGDHCQFPRNRGTLAGSHVSGMGSLDGSPPFVTLHLEIGDGTINAAAFEAAGCGITVACGSALTEWLRGRAVSECRSVSAESIAQQFSDFPSHKSYCAMVAARALQAALANYDGRENIGDS